MNGLQTQGCAAVCTAGQPATASSCTIPAQGTEATACSGRAEERMSDADEHDLSEDKGAPGSLDDAPASSMSEADLF
jgi:hypothetical protein